MSVGKDELINALNLIVDTEVRFWLDGGWGVDVLVGKQTRTHRDIDIDYDSRYTEKLLQALTNAGYTITTDEMPVRMELHHPKTGYLDIHPFVLSDDGCAKQADGDGGWYEFEPGFFGCAMFEGMVIPCISAKGQKIFHTGYELRDVDKHDLKNIEMLLNTVIRTYSTAEVAMIIGIHPNTVRLYEEWGMIS